MIMWNQTSGAKFSERWTQHKRIYALSLSGQNTYILMFCKRNWLDCMVERIKDQHAYILKILLFSSQNILFFCHYVAAAKYSYISHIITRKYKINIYSNI